MLTADLSLFGERYATAPSRAAFYRELVENVRALPGVQAAGAISDLPAVRRRPGRAARSCTRLTPTSSGSCWPPGGDDSRVTPGYFAASGTTLRAGRFFVRWSPT